MTMLSHDLPAPDALTGSTPVLCNRPLRPETEHSRLSVFEDDRWDFSPGVFEAQSSALRYGFEQFPSPWRVAVKHFVWLQVNMPAPPALRNAQVGARPALRTIQLGRTALIFLIEWVEAQGLRSMQDLTSRRLDEFLGHVGTLDVSTDVKSRRLVEVRRLWAYRELLPLQLQLPGAMPWGAETARELVGHRRQRSENLTPRIATATLSPLLTWSIRFITDFADDIIASHSEYQELSLREQKARLRAEAPPRRPGTPQERLEQTLNLLRERGLGLPGHPATDGKPPEIRWAYLGRLTDSTGISHATYDLAQIERSGLHIDDNAYLTTPCRGTLDGQLWRERPIPFDDARAMATHLVTACMIVVAYLSGMRPGEVISLRRGCTSFDAERKLWTVTGKHWKGVTDASGAKNARGQRRANPWVVHPIVAKAISVLERLHHHELLFPRTLNEHQSKRHKVMARTAGNSMGEARHTSSIGHDITNFTEWVNRYCEDRRRPDSIPDDGAISLSRFRRTLAWHIVRRPRGLIAASIQYGHVLTSVTQGYAGDSAAGFVDELAFERWLERMEDVNETDAYLADAGRVSGPAAEEFKRRNSAARAKFEGRTLPTTRQASRLLNDPLMQTFRGRGMHCVFSKRSALCVRDSDSEAPNLGECKNACQNIARTDADVASLEEEVATLQQLTGDPFAPTVRHQRLIAVVGPLRDAIDAHKEVTHD